MEFTHGHRCVSECFYFTRHRELPPAAASSRLTMATARRCEPPAPATPRSPSIAHLHPHPRALLADWPRAAARPSNRRATTHRCLSLSGLSAAALTNHVALGLPQRPAVAPGYLRSLTAAVEIRCPHALAVEVVVNTGVVQAALPGWCGPRIAGGWCGSASPGGGAGARRREWWEATGCGGATRRRSAVATSRRREMEEAGRRGMG